MVNVPADAVVAAIAVGVGVAVLEVSRLRLVDGKKVLLYNYGFSADNTRLATFFRGIEVWLCVSV